jgi:serine/threonine protein kinase/Tfp pilus assembly protein PilF
VCGPRRRNPVTVLKNSDGLSDSVPGVNKSPGKCEKCGATIQFHTGVCASCLLGEGLEAGDEVSRAVFESVIAEVDVPDKQWRLGDYEILDEIGRGGMGVIYLARQRHPNRIVAVKRVLNYHADSHETLKRFRREADAAASLDHPNILPIYEVSESADGLPFFSMKFATGGSLQKVASALRAEPRRCVQLMAKVARAVEYAHGQGILHRDLKPGNILLDGRGEPLVSDFGLAKWLDANKDITKSLTAFGTPGYTAPEQAEGDTAGLTPAADVYSLGAILFELLAGRPPFVGDNALAVIRQAAETPAPKLRSLSHSHDRDFETICARCLERDPKARYQTAGDLATDLERWLDGRPIGARPISVSTRLGRWSRRNPKLIATGAACLLFGAVTMWFFRGELAKVLPPAPDKSIAVLPFENLSRDPDNAYFADGIQEEILTRLASIADLKVISRSSTQRYHSKPGNLAEIAKQLGVANILEGSVQKTADQVRINVQLINAQTDSHLWAETYDRKLTDIFGVESEIAKRIAESLQAKLSGHEELTLAVKATKNLDAYDAYLRGLAFQTRSSWHSDDALRNAIDSYEQAVQLDPGFAPAWARLARAHAWKYSRAEGTVLRRDAATKALDNAQKLQPDSPETLLALGYYQRFVLDDCEAAKTTFRRVGEMLPSSSEVPMALGRIARNEGQWDESNSYFERALSMDPRNVELLAHAAWNYTWLRQFPTALKLYDRALDIVPNDSELVAGKASIYQAQGKLQEAVKLLPQINEQTTSSEAFRVKIAQMRLERRFDKAVHLLQTRLAQFRFFSAVEKSEYQAMLSFHLYLAGDRASANFIAKQARDEIESQLEGSLDWDNLALANAVMGNKDLAIKAAEHAGTLVPTVKDRVNGPSREEWLALIQTIVGENGPAISILTRLVQTPYLSWLYGGPVTPALLRLDPIWDPLRSDPAFQKLCEEKQP